MDDENNDKQEPDFRLIDLIDVVTSVLYKVESALISV